MKQRHRARRSTVAILEATIVLLSFLAVSLGFGALKPRVSVSTIGTISYGTQKIELGLRTAFWDDYIKSPTTFMNLSNGRVTLIYIDLPWVNELFTNFDPSNLDKPFAKGNWGYGYTFRDYIEFFRAVHKGGIKIVFAIAGIGSNSKPSLNFFSDYPASAVDSEWVNPDYVDSTWGGKTFIQMYAEKINDFARYVGIPAIVSVEDWRYPGYMMQYQQLMQFRTALKTLNQANDIWMPPASFGSARVADYNAYKRIRKIQAADSPTTSPSRLPPLARARVGLLLNSLANDGTAETLGRDSQAGFCLISWLMTFFMFGFMLIAFRKAAFASCFFPILV